MQISSIVCWMWWTLMKSQIRRCEWRWFVNILTDSNALHNRFWMKNTKYYVNMKLVLNSLCITICAHTWWCYGLEKAFCSLLLSLAIWLAKLIYWLVNDLLLVVISHLFKVPMGGPWIVRPPSWMWDLVLEALIIILGRRGGDAFSHQNNGRFKPMLL